MLQRVRWVLDGARARPRSRRSKLLIVAVFLVVLAAALVLIDVVSR